MNLEPKSRQPKFARLRSRALVAVQGPDRLAFLQGLLTQDVETLGEGEVRYGALLTPQGRLLFELFLTGRADAVLIDLPAAQRDALVQRLSLYRLRAKVEVEAVDGAVFALWDAAGAGPGWAPDPRLEALGWRATGAEPPPAPGAVEAGEDEYDRRRIALGVADTAYDRLPENTYPVEANLDLLNGVDFKKGCFVGQETTSRMKRRGQVRTRLAPLAVEGPAPAPGAEVLAGPLRAGEVVGGGEGCALALLRLDRAADGGLSIDGRPARAAFPPWLAPELEKLGG